MTRSVDLDTPLALPCGATLPNRLAKAAMTEGMADPYNRATPALEVLYRTWSHGGAGLLLTGNVQVDRAHLERPGNMVIDGNGGLDALKRLAQAGRSAGNHLWMQINHPGRQVERRINPNPSAPSAVPLEAAGDFGSPRAMAEAEVVDVIRRFAHVAAIARETGFSGVQIHSAHGYLLSQFLSPRANLRDDDWGGSLANRARLLLEIVRAVRQAVGADFPVSVKLNSADFQQGGFTMEESVQVASWLGEANIDLLELSGGNYERQSMSGIDTPESTRRREAHFLDFAHDLRPVVQMPVMVTGGFRTRGAMIAALRSGDTDVIGIGAPLCVEPDLPAKLLAGAAEGTWLDASQAKIYRDLAIRPEQMTITRGGCYLMTQLINIGRTGKIADDLTYNEAFAQFGISEDRIYEALMDFPPAGGLPQES